MVIVVLVYFYPGYVDQLTSALVWMSSGGTKSVVHYDDADNLNCLISGQKRMGELQLQLYEVYVTALHHSEDSRWCKCSVLVTGAQGCY